jgi:hypothetical protein
MLRYVLGGVALAATGYGVKKYFENDLSIFDTFSENEQQTKQSETLSELKEPIKKFEKSLNNLYSGVLRELRIAVNEIDNLSKDEFCVDFESSRKNYNFTCVNEETVQNFNKYVEILGNVEKYIFKHLDTLDTIIISSNNFTKYSKEDKELIQELIYIYKIIDRINYQEITSDRETISREIKRAFGKLEVIIA